MKRFSGMKALILSLVAGLGLTTLPAKAEYWPIAKPAVTFEAALDLAKARLKQERDKGDKVLTAVPLENFILVKVVYGTEKKDFDHANTIGGKVPKETWGWTFQFANHQDASVSAMVFVADKDKVKLLEITT